MTDWLPPIDGTPVQGWLTGPLPADVRRSIERLARDKLSLDILWLKDKSLEDSDDLPPPDELSREIANDRQNAWEQFAAIADKLKG